MTAEACWERLEAAAVLGRPEGTAAAEPTLATTIVSEATVASKSRPGFEGFGVFDQLGAFDNVIPPAHGSYA